MHTPTQSPNPIHYLCINPALHRTQREMGTMQDQYPSDAFSPDFRRRSGNKTVFPELQNGDVHQMDNLIGGQRIFNSGTEFSDVQSELTGSASGSRKRARYHVPNQGMLQQLQCPDPMKLAAAMDAGVLSGLQHEQGRMYGSAGASISGRRPAPISPFTQDLATHLYQQSVEMDTLIRLQTDRLRLGLGELRKMHCRAMLSVLEQHGVKRLREKEVELESVCRQNAELEERVRVVGAESQIWFDVAKNSEAVVSSLRATLEQVLLQSAAMNMMSVPNAEEGYGDSDEIPHPDDTNSCCFVGEERESKVYVGMESAATARQANKDKELRCKACLEREVCVLLLPCRHLCLCKDCEPRLERCPVCHYAKKASLQISMS